MRKYIRRMLARHAERIGVKPSEYVKKHFEKIQIKKYGADHRAINKLNGTRPKRKWIRG